jgi:hypothetical protein
MAAARWDVFSWVVDRGTWPAWLGSVGDAASAQPASQVRPGDTFTFTLAAAPGLGPVVVAVTDLWPSQYLEGCLRCEALGEFWQQWLFSDASEGSSTVTVVSTVSHESDPAAVQRLADAVDRILGALAEHVTGAIHSL